MDTKKLTGGEEQEQGFLVTKGRFVDILLVILGLITLLFSLITFIGITSSLVITTKASNVPHHRCILYSKGNEEQTEIVFGGSGPCYTVFVQPIGSLVLIPLLVFLFIKIWKRWNISLLVFIWTAVLLILFTYTFVAACLVSAGERVTCSSVANLTHPLGGKQSCSQGGAYFNVTMGPDGYARFDDWVDLAEAGIWISTLLILTMAVTYIARCVVWVVRAVRKN